MIMGRTAGYRGLFGLTGVAVFAATLALPFAGMAHSASDVFEAGVSVDLPSGQSVSFLDVIEGVEGSVGSALRYRFLAPQIARATGDVPFMQAEDDMAALCQDYVLPHLVESAVDLPSQIIIVLADRKVEFGIADPEATQFFEAYRPEDGQCIWEGF